MLQIHRRLATTRTALFSRAHKEVQSRQSSFILSKRQGVTSQTGAELVGVDEIMSDCQSMVVSASVHQSAISLHIYASLVNFRVQEKSFTQSQEARH